jgi:hypothetical protein
MTNRTAERPVRHDALGATPPRPSTASVNRSVQQAGLIAGIGLLLLTAMAVFANFIVIEGLVTPGDAATSATDIMAAEGMFRLGIAGWFVIAALDVVIAWALFRVFSPVNTGISRLAAWLRLAYAAVLMVAITELMGALRLLGNDGYLDVIGTDQLQAQALLRINAFTDVFDAGLILFGLHLLVLGYLAYRSRYVPRLVGVLLGIAGVGYLFDSFTAVLGMPTNVGAFTFIGEFLLGLWLLIRSRRITLSEPTSRDDFTEITR